MRLAQCVAIVGAGTGGTMVANRLARRMGKELEMGSREIVVFSDTSSHFYQSGFLYVALGLTWCDKKSPNLYRWEMNCCLRSIA